MEKKPASQFPDYFAMLNAMAGPLSQVAQAFTSKAATDAAAQMANNAMPSLDPEEIDKKIRELETVLVWLRAQVGAVELSVKAMEMQRDFLRSLKASPQEPAAEAHTEARAEKSDGEKTASPLGQFGQLGQFASALNPAKWAEKIMPSVMPSAGTASTKATGKKRSAAKRKPAARKPAGRTPRSD
jgi:hypothetical protein